MRWISQLIHLLILRIREQARSHIWIFIHLVDGDWLWLWLLILIFGAPLNTLAGIRHGFGG